MEFSKRLDLFGDEIFAALNERKVALEAQGRTIYNLSVGTPDFAPAEHIRKAMMDAAADPQNWKYSLRDLPELLDAVCGCPLPATRCSSRAVCWAAQSRGITR